jgi:NAD(P)-dependent dehydrogenase (short-subunit alcohol dehydrogenase family)
VITGGGSGLGQVIAQIYGMRGASVAVLDIKEVSEVEGWDELSGVEYYKCDVGDRKALELTGKKIENDVSFPHSVQPFLLSIAFRYIHTMRDDIKLAMLTALYL